MRKSEYELAMPDLISLVFAPGNIVGIGESTHGSQTEFEWKYSLILEMVKNNPNTKIICFIEAYSDPIAQVVLESIASSNNIDGLVIDCLKKMYSIWQTQETYNFLVELVRLIVIEKRDIQIIGIDFRDKEHKQSLDQSEMLRIRDEYMFDTIKKNYQSDAVHFIIAHNAHIGRYAEPDKSIGYLLDQEYVHNYIPIAQYVSHGSVRVKWSGRDYQSVDFTHDDLPGSITTFSNALFSGQNAEQPVVFTTLDPELKDVTKMQQIGFFLPLEQSWVMPFGKRYFDYIVLHPKSESAEPVANQ